MTQSRRSRTPWSQAAFIQPGLQRQGFMASSGSMGSGRSQDCNFVSCLVTDSADDSVGAGVVVAGAGEAAAVVVVEWDLVGVTRQPGQDVAAFGELVAVVGG